MINQRLYEYLIDQFQPRLTSVHGIEHWKRVETIGMYLATFTQANRTVITHFAYIHDSKRLNDEDDIDHGERAAVFCEELSQKGLLMLAPKLLNQLKTACQMHSYNNAKPKDATIAACLDADRLDLIRMNITPSPTFLFSAEAKRLAREGDEVISRIATQSEL